MNWRQVCKLGLELPEVAEGTWYGTPGLTVRGKGFVRLRPELEAIVFLLDDVSEQEDLVAAQPELYFVTDHYLGHAAVLARLTALRAPECRLRLAQSWRRKAPAALVQGLDIARAPRRSARRGRSAE